MPTTLRKSQLLPISLPAAWEFFSDPANLPSLTPPAMGFRILSPAPERIHPGLILRYSVKPLPGYRTGWVSEITEARAPEFFVDEQRSGPYRSWRHEHFLRVVDGGVRVEDVVRYEIPFGVLGRWLAGGLVKRRLEAIFAFRARALQARFGTL
jgi:ligand-binding SRPBCC domain-containing protein